MRLLVVWVICFTLVACATQARAQEQPARSARMREAKSAFDSGLRAYTSGEFAVALERFQRAYDLTGSPDLLYNIATVSDRMRLDEAALDAYRGYLEARPKSADRQHVESRIEVLSDSIERRKAAEIEAKRAAIEAAARVKEERPLTRYVGPGPGPWITIGVGGATVVAGAVLVGLGQRDQNKVEDAPEGSSYSSVQELAERGPRRTKAGIALMSVGGAAVVGGIIWRLTGGHEETMPEVSIGPTGITVRGKF